MVFISRDLSQNNNPDAEIGLIVHTVFFGLGLLLLLAIIIYFVSGQKKKQKHLMESVLTKEELQEELEQEEREKIKEKEETKKETEEKMELYKQVLKITEQEKPSKQPKVQRKPLSVVSKELIKKLTYKEQIKEEKCSICKLELRKNQDILQCPECQALFHKEHLIDWLETKKDCPVCHVVIRE